MCFRDLGDSKIDPKIDAGKKASKWLSGAQGAKEFWLKTLETWPGGMRVIPKTNHFKRILRKKTNEESRMKGEYKVECKKWSAKGTYRKASADREPTTHANTLGGQRPRADSKRERAFRQARYL